MSSHNEKHHIVSFQSNAQVLLVLLFFTAVTVLAAGIQMESKALSVIAALVIATVKAVIVLMYFMHLRFDSKLLTLFVAITMLIFITVIVITSLDYIYR